MGHVLTSRHFCTMSTPLRILQICHKPPRPAVDGGCMAMDSLTTGLLQEGHQLKVLTLHTHKHPFLEAEITPSYLEATDCEAVFAETELNLRDAFSHVVTGESYHLSRFHVPEMERAIEENLRERVFDVIILESLFTTSYIPAIRRLSDAELVLRAHNVEHQLWQEVSSGMGRGPKRWLLDLFQGKLYDEEVRIMGDVDAVVAMTDKDAAWFENALAGQREDAEGRVTWVPFGLDVEGRKHNCIQEPPNHILHLGAMNWTPNVQGVTWLKDEVWPSVHEVLPNARLLLAGRNMPESWESDADRGIRILGEVDSAEDTYDTPCAVVVPLHAGSGMRIKLAEALASGRPVITTSKGMEGLALTHEEHVLVANTTEEMQAALTRVLEEPALALRLGQNGRAWAMEHLGHRASARAMIQHLQTWVNA